MSCCSVRQCGAKIYFCMQGLERKVQQLTKVIYHLNSKGGEEADEYYDEGSDYDPW